MRTAPVLLAAVLTTSLLGCARENEPAPVEAPEAVEPAPAEPSPATPASAVDGLPEELVLDAALEAPVRAKAAELDAITPRAVGHLKVGDEKVVLVRAVSQGRGYSAIYGSGPYTLDSGLRPACIHAGLLQENELALVRVKVFKHDGPHPAEERHGIRPHKWGAYHASYTIEKVAVE